MLNNQDFARLRAKSLGGSDIGAILGLSKYRTAVDVWMQKTGKQVEPKDSISLRFGQFAEEFVAKEYARSTHELLVHHPEAIIHPDYPFMHGHIDRFIVSNQETLFDTSGKLLAQKILECKTANPFSMNDWGEPGTDQIPLPYLVQCVWYMMLTNIDLADLAVLFGNAEFRIYQIQRDLELEQLVLNRALSFWNDFVMSDQPPPATSEADYKQLFAKGAKNKTIEAKTETYDLIKKLHVLNSQINVFELEASKIKQHVMDQMQDAEVLQYQGEMLATWKTPKQSFRFDTKKFGVEHPELIERYQTPIQNSRRLNIKELI